MLLYPANDSVSNVTACDVRAGGCVWRYGVENSVAIDAAWETARARNPAYFNGQVYLTDAFAMENDRLTARLLKTDFKSYLHWRHAGFPQTGVLDGFGSALLMSSDGAVVLGRQRAGNVNAGLAYLPGGFIDGRDVEADGRVDIAASIRRELAEETGLAPSEFTQHPGFLITQSHAQLSMAVVFATSLDATALKARIDTFIAADGQSELAEAVIVRRAGDLDGLAMPRYARVLVSAVLTRAARSDL